MANERILDYGAQNFTQYKMNETAQTYGPGIKQLGLVSAEKTENQESEDKYADNRVHKTVQATKTIEGTYVFLQVDEETKTEFLGEVKNANGALTDGGSKPRLASAHSTKFLDGDNEERYRIKVVYDIIYGALSETDETTTDGVTETTHELPYTGKVSNFVKNDNGQLVSKLEFDCPKGTTEDDVISMLTTIPMPTDPIVNFVDAEGTIALTDGVGELTADVTLTLNDASSASVELYESTDLNKIVAVQEITETGSLTFSGLEEGSYVAFLLSSTSAKLGIATGDVTSGF